MGIWGLVASVGMGLLGRRDARKAEDRARADAKASRKVALEDDRQRFVRLREAAELGGFNPLTALNSGYQTSLPSGFLSASDTLAAGAMRQAATSDAASFYNTTKGLEIDARRAAVDEGNLALDRERLSLERERLQASILSSPYGPSHNFRTGPSMGQSAPGLGQSRPSSAGTWSGAAPSMLSGGAFAIAPTVTAYTTTGLEMDEDGNLVPRDLATGGGSWIDVDETVSDAEDFEARYSEPGGWYGAALAATADADRAAPDGLYSAGDAWRQLENFGHSIRQRTLGPQIHFELPAMRDDVPRASGEPRRSSQGGRPRYQPPALSFDTLPFRVPRHSNAGTGNLGFQ